MGGADVVVVAVDLDQAGIIVDDTLLDPVDAAFVLIQAGVLVHDVAVICEREVGPVAVLGVLMTEAGVEVGVLAGIVGLAVHIQPCLACPLACPSVTAAGGIGHDLTLDQDVVLELVAVAVDDLGAVHSRAGCGIKVVVVDVAVGIHHSLPAGLGCAADYEVQAVFILQHAGDGADAGTVIVEGVEVQVVGILVTGHALQACHGNIVHIVVQEVFIALPALTVGGVQDEAVFKGGVDIAEACALFGGAADDHVGVIEGLQVVQLLVCLLQSEGVQRIRAQVDVVADLTGADDRQLVGAGPCRVILGDGGDAAEDADGVGGFCGDRGSLVDPLADDGHGVGFFVKDNVFLLEILVDDLQFGVVDLQIGIEPDGGTDFSQNADTLSQLQQEVPCGGVHIVAAGQHVDQIGQLFGDLDGGHIQAEGVFHFHALAGVNHLEENAVSGGGVGNNTVPCKLTVTGGNIVEVEECLVLAVQVDTDGVKQVVVSHQDRVNSGHTDAGGLVAGEGQAVEGTGGIVLSEEEDIFRVDGNVHAVVACGDGQFSCHAVNGVQDILGEVDGIGNHHGQGLGTCHSAVSQDQLHLNLAVGLGGEHIAVNGAHSLIGQLPGSALGNIGGAAGCADAHGSQLQAGADGQVIILRGDQGMVKLVGDLCGGNDHQRGADAALVAVGGAVDDSDVVSALFLGGIGGGTAAVQVHGDDTAGIQHDLCDLLAAAACGVGLLTAVQDHQNDLAFSSDADAGSGSTGIVVLAGVAHYGLAVTDQDDAAADGFRNAVLVGIPFSAGADDRGAVIQDGEEVVAVGRHVGNTFHDQGAAGLTGGHVVEVAVDANDGGKVLNVAVIFHSSRDLVRHTGHAPTAGRIVVLVVGVDSHVASGDIHSGDMVSQLLVIGSVGILDALGDAGSQGGIGAGEHGVIAVVSGLCGLFRLGGLLGIGRLLAFAALTGQGVACQLIQVISEGITAGLPQLGQIGQAAVSFQNLQTDVGPVGLEHGVADIVLGQQAAEAVVHEVLRPVSVGQLSGEVSFKHFADGTAGLDLVVQIVGVHIAVEVVHAEGIVGIHAEAVLQDVVSHLVDGAGRHLAEAVAVLQQVAEVACPAAQVAGGHSGDVGNVQGAEHMAEVHLVAVGDHEIVFHDVAQAADGGAVGCVLLSNVGDESGDLFACQGLPVAVQISVDTGTDIVDDQLGNFVVGICGCKVLGVAFQDLQICQESGVIGHFQLIVFCLSSHCFGFLRGSFCLSFCFGHFGRRGAFRFLGHCDDLSFRCHNAVISLACEYRSGNHAEDHAQCQCSSQKSSQTVHSFRSFC